MGGATGLSARPHTRGRRVTVADNAIAGGSFTYIGSDGTLTDPRHGEHHSRHDHRITGTGANDIIVGNTGVNAINGGGGNDHINAGDGGDAISGGTGNDPILAGTGNDHDHLECSGWRHEMASTWSMAETEARPTPFVVNGVTGTGRNIPHL